MQLPDGLAKLAAPSGKFNPINQQVDVAGPITFAGPNGYSLQSNAATVDLKKKTMQGSGGVSGTVPQGTFTADTMSADLDNRVVHAQRPCALADRAATREIGAMRIAAPLIALAALAATGAAIAQSRHDSVGADRFRRRPYRAAGQGRTARSCRAMSASRRPR